MPNPTATMRAYVGTPAGPSLRTVPEPQPAPDEALVRVEAFSVNRGELGLFGRRPEGWRHGQDIAGRVLATAADGGGRTVARIVVAAAGRTGKLVAQFARCRGHEVRGLERLDDGRALVAAVRGADALVLIPRGGDAERQAHGAAVSLTETARRLAPRAHIALVTSFAVGHGAAHPLNRIASLPGRRAAERTVRASGLPWTIVRPTWLTDDPRGVHAVTLTQDPYADGMLSRADLAAALVAAVEQPAARGKTFALFNQPGEPPADWATAFAALAPDHETHAA
jgi:uncharacterized protein YbjT (DUF2867 family)